MGAIKARSEIMGNEVFFITDPVGTPITDKEKDRCGVFPDFQEGAICYQVCGEIPQGREIETVGFFTRLAHQEGRASLEACDGGVCDVTDVNVSLDRGSVCGNFKLWKGESTHRELVIKATLV